MKNLGYFIFRFKSWDSFGLSFSVLSNTKPLDANCVAASTSNTVKLQSDRPIQDYFEHLPEIPNMARQPLQMYSENVFFLNLNCQSKIPAAAIDSQTIFG